MKQKKKIKASLLISITFLFLLTLIISFIFIISIKPIKVNFLNYFDRESEIFNKIQITEIGDVFLSFNKVSRNFEVLIEDLVIDNSYLPNILIGIDLTFKKKIYELSLKVFDGDVEINLPKEYQTVADESLLSNRLKENLILFNNFSSIQIINTKLKLNFEKNIYRDYLIDLELKNSKILCSISEGRDLDNYLSFEFLSKNDQHIVNLDSKKFNFNFLKYFLNLRDISLDNLYLTGSSNFIINSDKSVESFLFSLYLDGNLNYPTFKGIEKVDFLKSQIYGEKDIDKVDVILNLNHLETQFKTVLRLNLKNVNLSKIYLEFDKIQVSDLMRIWPKGLSPSVYFWMNENSNGKINDLSVNSNIFNMNGELDFNNPEGKFHFSETEIRYMDSMPPVKNINGSAIIKTESIEFIVNTGISEKLFVKSGFVNLHDLTTDAEKARINLDISGTNQEVVDYLKLSPINKKSYSKLESIYGETIINLNLEFPLILDLPAEEIEYKSSVSIQNAIFEDIYNNLDLEKFSIFIEIDNSSVEYSGTASIFNSTSNFSGNQFISNNLIKEEIQGTYVIREEVFDFLFPNYDISVDGRIEIDFKITEDGEGFSKIEGIGALDELILNSDFVGKNLDFNKGKVQFLIRPYDNLFSGFLNVNSKDLKVEVNSLFNRKGIVELDIQNFKSPIQDFKFNYKTNENKISVDGKKLILKKIDIFQDSDFDLDDLEFNLDINLLELAGMSFSYPKVSFIKTNGIFERMLFELNGENDFHKISIYDEIDEKKFVLESNYIPGLLKIFDLDFNVNKGSIKIEGSRPSEKLEYSGVVVGKNIVFYDAPFFANFFSIFSLDGFAQKLKDGGIIFNSLNANYRFGNNRLKIVDSLLKGSELGIQFDSVIGINDDYFLTNGSIIPAYTINTLITKFPILGDIITAGSPEDGLIGANFRVEKVEGEYEVFYNPISVFVPNIIKNFLGN